MTLQPPPGPPTPPISPERLARVAAATGVWKHKLIDTSRRNRLLYFRSTAKTLSLDAADHGALARLLAGKQVPPADLLPRFDPQRPERLNDIITNIRREADIFAEEKGLHTLYLGAGMATWDAGDGGRPTNAPVVLIPVTISERYSGEHRFVIQRNGDETVNLVLLHALDLLFGVKVEEETLLAVLPDLASANDIAALQSPPDASAAGVQASFPAVTGEPEPPAAAEAIAPQVPPELAAFDPVFALLREACTRVPGFHIDRRFALANLQFQKAAILGDLEHLDELAGNDLVAAIAGVPEARSAIAARAVSVDPRTLDNHPVGEQPLILSADSSQQSAIEAIIQGASGVIVGPPGTGKSQTIANLIAALVAREKRVLFVAEKRAALEVVHRRLEAAGLGHLALDLHAADVSRAAVITELREAHEIATKAASAEMAGGLLTTLEQTRDRLRDHMRDVNELMPGVPRSVYELQGIAVSTPPAMQATTRWRAADLRALAPDFGEHTAAILDDASGIAPLFTGGEDEPWSAAHLDTAEDVQGARELVYDLRHRLLPGMQAALAELGAHCRAAPAETLAQATHLARYAPLVAAAIGRYGPDLPGLDLDAATVALAPAEKGGLGRLMARLFNGGYRAAVREWTQRRNEPAAPAIILHELREARDALSVWPAGFAEPTDVALVERTSAAVLQAEAAIAALDAIVPLFGGGDDLDAIAQRVETLLDDETGAQRMPTVRRMHADLRSLGAGAFLDELRMRRAHPETWVPMLDYALARSWLDAILPAVSLGAFSGDRHRRLIEAYQTQDEQFFAAFARALQGMHGDRYFRALNAYPEQAAILQPELQKRRRHKAVRRLIAEAPEVFFALAPCVMASPLSLSQFIPPESGLFDVVIFDEASQVFPEDAIPSFMRAKQVVVAGDPHQLPPTNFFQVTEEDTDEDNSETSAVTGFESILDLLLALMQRWTLDWHYRSRDEKLIAFSNEVIYGGRLVTFPGPRPAESLRHLLVETSPEDNVNEDSVSAEVRAVVDLVFQHSEQRPGESLGVIALGVAHANRIEAALQQRRRERRDLDPFFDRDHEEPFFVKNLERVQGDERDAIILTAGYGRRLGSGQIRQNFGPINQEGGERRLNVAITRARSRMTVVSSFASHDIDLSRTQARGVAVLRDYLAYAENGGRSAPGLRLTDVALNPFESDVYDTLNARGYRLVPQLGVSGYRIDFGVQHPERPGEFVLAIECDGASYHSAATVRERDRLRQQHLEALGWRFYRIWSTDWFLTREQAINDCAAAIDAAIAAGGRAGRPAPAVPPPPPPQGVPAAFHQAFAGDPVAEPAPPALPPEPTRERARRPLMGRRPTIEHYTTGELADLIAWIQSDAIRRTDEEIIQIALKELGFGRMGSRIRAALLAGVRKARRAGRIA